MNEGQDEKVVEANLDGWGDSSEDQFFPPTNADIPWMPFIVAEDFDGDSPVTCEEFDNLVDDLDEDESKNTECERQPQTDEPKKMPGIDTEPGSKSRQKRRQLVAASKRKTKKKFKTLFDGDLPHGCLLKICQFPVSIANAVNASNYDELNRVICRHVIPNVSFHTKPGNITGNGRDTLESIMNNIMDSHPDMFVTVRNISLQPCRFIKFEMSMSGTFCGPVEKIESTPKLSVPTQMNNLGLEMGVRKIGHSKLCRKERVMLNEIAHKANCSDPNEKEVAIFVNHECRVQLHFVEGCAAPAPGEEPESYEVVKDIYIEWQTTKLENSFICGADT